MAADATSFPRGVNRIEGEVNIRANLKNDEEGSAEFLFEVKDADIGIPEDQIGHLLQSL